MQKMPVYLIFIIFFPTLSMLWGLVVSKLDWCSGVKMFKFQSKHSLFYIQMNVIIARKTFCSIAREVRYFSHIYLIFILKIKIHSGLQQ